MIATQMPFECRAQTLWCAAACFSSALAFLTAIFCEWRSLCLFSPSFLPFPPFPSPRSLAPTLFTPTFLLPLYLFLYSSFAVLPFSLISLPPMPPTASSPPLSLLLFSLYLLPLLLLFPSFLPSLSLPLSFLPPVMLFSFTHRNNANFANNSTGGRHPGIPRGLFLRGRTCYQRRTGEQAAFTRGG